MARIRANGNDIEYDEIGPRGGAPILMINGFGSQMVSWPDEFREGLAAQGLRYIRFDNRDVGLARKWDGILPDPRAVTEAVRAGRKPDIPYTLDDMAADAACLLDALAIESAHICGASMGGMIAQLVALNHPQKSRSLISIFSTSGEPALPPATPEAMAALTGKPESSDRASVIAHALKGRRAYASTKFPFNETRIAGQIGLAYDRSYYPEGTARQFAAIAAAAPRTERLKLLKVPTLVLHGSADTLLPPQHGRHTAQCVQGAKYHEIDGWGHDMPLEVIPQVLGLVLPFVRNVEASRKDGYAMAAA